MSIRVTDYSSAGEPVMSVAAFVIALRSAVERTDQVDRLIAASPVPCRRWDATDGRALSAEETARYHSPELHHPHYGFGLTAAEIGCFLSHRRIWQQIVDESLSHALIMEDDLELLPNFEAVFDFALHHAPPTSFIKFHVHDFHGRGSPIVEVDGLSIVRPETIPLRATAQLVTRAAAERLLEQTRTFDRPVDTFLQMRWLHNVDILVAHPRCTAEVSAQIGGSIINRHKRPRPLFQSVLRECQRAIYRRHVSQRSRRNAAA